MRARAADRSGYVERGGVRTYYEVYGTAANTLLLLPCWSIVHSRVWKGQIPYLARTYRVIAFDGRGNGLSGRPLGAEAYRAEEYMADAIAVMDATETERAVLVGFSFGGHLAALLAANHPERVVSAMLFAPAAPFGPGTGVQSQRAFRSFTEFFFQEALNEPHSTKQIEDCIAWASETSAETMIDTVLGRFLSHPDEEQTYRKIRCPVVVVHGDRDAIVPHARGKRVAESIGAPLLTLEGSGHLPIAREPVVMNRLIREFADRSTGRVAVPAVLRRGPGRRNRILYLSSPIGLGHGRRDLAIACRLREMRPEIRIDWLAQHPVTALLERANESIHPASQLLVNESQHIEGEAGEHVVRVFQALRRMDEILVANFMVFHEVVEEGQYDLVIADESWDVDHYWHEHAELKRCALAWFTDFVGYLPMPQGGDREAYLTADYNAEMLEHIERYPRVRDRAIFVGDPDDIVGETFGPGLPSIRSWTQQHFEFSGYITGIDPGDIANRAELRHRFGYGDNEKVCIVTVGGSAVGAALLQRVIDSTAAVRRM